jgi:hypothetical protein
MHMAAMRREEKEIPILREDMTPENAGQLYQICQKHRIRLLTEARHFSVVMTESSIDLPEFAIAVAESGVLDRMPEEKRAALLRDFATLECP